MSARDIQRWSFKPTSVLLTTVCLVAIVGARSGGSVFGDDLVIDVEFQPLASQVGRLIQTMEFIGEPFTDADRATLESAAKETDQKKGVELIQKTLDAHCLARVDINPESRVKCRPGLAPKKLTQQGWRSYLVKVVNEAGVTSALEVGSPNALTLVKPGSNAAEPKPTSTPGDVPHRFLDVAMVKNQPMSPTLSGLKLEYRVVQLYCRDVGKREVTLGFHVGQGTQDLGFRGETSMLFEAEPSTETVIRVVDENGKPTTASFIFRDKLGRVYPSQSRRLAPDFFFHPQVYRKDGESVHLPAGDYSVEWARGPEYLPEKRTIVVPKAVSHQESFKLTRWVEPKKRGWYSGDHHVHAAGCAHYDSPMQGVQPADMFRHIVGEDLNIGCVLSWGPCWYYQKQYFEGKVSALSITDHVMRYDVEVSGFPSSHCGHLCLLNLVEDDYPKTDRIEQWPSYNEPILRWTKAQGGVTGYSHSASGLIVNSTELPNYEIPPFDGIGANEFIVNAPLKTCDFISTVDTCATAELNIWYHTLNCGCDTRISGETDFPCIYGQRVGIGRIYAKIDGPLEFKPWVDSLKAGRSYVSDGMSHIMDFKADGFALGSSDGKLKLDRPKTVKLEAHVVARLNERADKSIADLSLLQPPYWHLERARVKGSRKAPIEVVVNGKSVARRLIEADGKPIDLTFEAPIERSSWVALRIFPSSHTNPIFIEVGDKPIRASKRSAEWCVKCVDACFRAKSPNIRPKERAEARTYYDQAKNYYQKVIDESTDE